MNILFLALLGVGIFLFTSRRRKMNTSSSQTQSAISRLNERFVNGEIDEDTFNKIKEVIN